MDQEHVDAARGGHHRAAGEGDGRDRQRARQGPALPAHRADDGLWDGPHFKAKAVKPAEDVLPELLTRAWHDLRGAAGQGAEEADRRQPPQAADPLKELRYGCETVALIEGTAARKTARAAERLQGQLGDLHDADFSIDWFEALAVERPDLADPIDELIGLQEDAASEARKGWKKGAEGGRAPLAPLAQLTAPTLFLPAAPASSSRPRPAPSSRPRRLRGRGRSLAGGAHHRVGRIPELDPTEDPRGVVHDAHVAGRANASAAAGRCRRRGRGGRRTSAYEAVVIAFCTRLFHRSSPISLRAASPSCSS